MTVFKNSSQIDKVSRETVTKQYFNIFNNNKTSRREDFNSKYVFVNRLVFFFRYSFRWKSNE